MNLRYTMPGLFLIQLFLAAAAFGETEQVIREGSVVTMEYTLSLEDGSVVDASPDGEPVQYTQGQGDLLPAVEQALAGAAPGDTREFTLPPEQAFGSVREDAVMEIDLERLPEDARQVGAALVISNDQGQQHMIRVTEINGDKAVIDFNHPLAGKTVHFKIQILSIN